MGIKKREEIRILSEYLNMVKWENKSIDTLRAVRKAYLESHDKVYSKTEMKIQRFKAALPMGQDSPESLRRDKDGEYVRVADVMDYINTEIANASKREHRNALEDIGEKVNETTKEKAEFWLAMNVSGYTQKQVDALTLLLKEQDRDTRHACAENIWDCPEICETANGNSAIDVNIAHTTIMNTRAV